MKLTTLISSLPPSTPFHTYEFFPPRTQPGLQNLIDRIERLCSPPLSPPLAISVTWGAGGSTAARSLELAQEIVEMQLDGRRDKVEVILHLTCTNMKKNMVDEALKVRSNGRNGQNLQQITHTLAWIYRNAEI